MRIFKPKYKVGDVITYEGVLPDWKGEYMTKALYTGTVISVGGNWLFGYYYCVEKPAGALYNPAVYKSMIINTTI